MKLFKNAILIGLGLLTAYLIVQGLFIAFLLSGGITIIEGMSN